LLGFSRVTNFASKVPGSDQTQDSEGINMSNAQALFLEDARHSFAMSLKLHAFPNFKDCISFQMSQRWNLTGVSSSVVESRASTIAST
jgi:hypothetical protein